jgi:hypothetical protein
MKELCTPPTPAMVTATTHTHHLAKEDNPNRREIRTLKD